MKDLLSQLASDECLRKAWASLEKRPNSYGFDGVTIQTFRNNLDANVDAILSDLKHKVYEYYPLRLYLSEKKDHGYRQIKIPTIRDRVVQRAMADLISPYLDAKYKITNDASFAYVKFKNVEKAAKKLIDLTRAGNRFVCKADIVKFFDRINKNMLMQKIADALPDSSINALIEKALANDILNSPYFEEKMGSSFVPDSVVGIAQGSPLSPLFANVYLAKFDQAIKDKGYDMIRYADDFVIATPTREDAKEAYSFAAKLLSKLKLQLYPLKDDIPVHLWKKDAKYSEARSVHQLDFLGLRFMSGKIYPGGSAYKNIIKNLNEVADDKKLGLVKKLSSLHSRVQSWCNTYSYAVMEQKHVIALDDKLELALVKLVKNHGLAKASKKSLCEIFGIDTFTQTNSKIAAKKDRAAKKLQMAIERAKEAGYPVEPQPATDLT